MILDGSSIIPIRLNLKKEGERAIDQLETELKPFETVETNNTLYYLQDMISLDNLSAIYNFQNTEKDESGNNNHGTATDITYGDGSWDDKIALFNGTSSMISIPDNNTLDLSGKFDIFIWANWSSTTQEYLLSKRSSTSDGVAISVNGTTSGDVTVDINGTTITSSTAGYNGTSLVLIRVVRDENNLVTLFINDVSKGSATIAGDLTNTESLVIGRDYSTGYYSGNIARLRIYKDYNAEVVEASNLYSNRNSRSTMKFGGFVTKIEDETKVKKITAQSFGKVLAETEIRGDAYDNQTPEFIVEDLITKNTNFTYKSSSGASGITLTKYTADGKLVDIIKDFASITNRLFYTNALQEFIFDKIKFNSTVINLTHGTNVKILKNGYDDTQIVNDLTIIGQRLRYSTIETLSGDGSTTEFILNYGAVTTRVKIGGVEKTPEEDYIMDSVGKKITFTSAPASGSNNIEVDYTYEEPMVIQGKRQSSIDKYGVHAKRLVLNWIDNRGDGVRFIQSYLNRHKEVEQKIKVEIPTLYNSIQENDIVFLTNTNSNISGEFVVRVIEYNYPEYHTSIDAGEYYFDYFEYERDVVRKIHDVEGALTTIKEIRDYESLEDIITVNDIVIQIITENFTESLNMGDTPVIYDKNDNNYGSGTYGSRVTGSVYVSE